ncbi:hypothetical protein GCM10009634_22690 [Saccharothrix xinjiangensis]
MTVTFTGVRVMSLPECRGLESSGMTTRQADDLSAAVSTPGPRRRAVARQVGGYQLANDDKV